jgi:RNA polymerase sigma-70 factor (ECF subfamily)
MLWRDTMTPEERETFRVLRAQAGDRDALGELFEALERPLYGYLRGITRRPELAEDVLQEVFLRVHRKLRWLRDPALFRPWVYRIAAREAVRHMRRERRWTDRAVDVEILAALPAPAGPAADLVASLPALAETLSPSSRAVLLLHYGEGLTIEEAAAVLGIPVGTTKSRLAYGLGALRKRLRGGTSERSTPP